MFSIKNWKIKRLIKNIKAMQQHRVHNQPSDDLIKKEIAYSLELANFFKNMKSDKRNPYPKILLIECYRAAANLDCADAHVALAQLFISEAKYRMQLDTEGIFNSKENLKQSEALFKEALIHLDQAEKLDHPKGKRLKGICYINGWGVTANQKTGLELVITSIEQEGCWDKVPQILVEIGLDKPDFFAAMLQGRKTG